jgi:hypothetical protein
MKRLRDCALPERNVLFLVDSAASLTAILETTLKALAARALRFGVNDVIDEENYGGGMFRSLAQAASVRPEGRSFDEEWKGWCRAEGASHP